MVKVDEAVIAKLKTHGQTFEILVDCDKAIALKQGKDIDMAEVLAADKIFDDSAKGLLASENALKSIFGTEDTIEIAKEIIKKGDIQLTSEYRNKLREQKHKEIVQMIHRNGVDPKTMLPHPPNRIENAIEEAKFTVDEFKDTKKQVEELLKKLITILPIKFVMKEIAVKIPALHASKSYQTVHSFGKVLKDEWLSDGSWAVVIEMPGGLEHDFYDKLNEVCHGEIETKVLKTR